MKSIFITGSNGGIGSAIAKYFKNKNYKVVGLDLGKDINNLDAFFNIDLNNLVLQKNAREIFKKEVESISTEFDFHCLVNNAAIQITGSIKDMSTEDFVRTFNINTIAPFFLSKLFSGIFSKSNANIINIGSIHSKLTKQDFSAYAASKAALLSLTKSLSIELGQKIRVNSVQPAAVDTTMLRKGFRNNIDLKDLKSYHPTNSICTTKEIAKCIEFIIEKDMQFLNGSNIKLDGGIGSRLHDPN